MTLIVELLDARVRDEMESLPDDMKARFRRIVELIQEYGLERMREPQVKHLEGPLWEMRMKGRDGISRSTLLREGDALSWSGRSSRKPRKHRAGKLIWHRKEPRR